MPTIDPAWIALVGTVCGGVGLKVTENWLGRSKIKVDDASQIRDELRLEITAQKEEIRQLETDVEKWRADYYLLFEKYIAQQTELTIALQKIKAEAIDAEAAINAIDKKPPPAV